MHGLIAFDPAAVRDDTDVPPVVFTNFLLANKPVAIGTTSPLRQAIDQTDTIALTYAGPGDLVCVRGVELPHAAAEPLPLHAGGLRRRLD
jgi:hypothetical protein